MWISEYRRWLSESESLANAQLVVNYFIGSDWTRESLSAMLGNMRHESSVNPDMYEYDYDWSEDRGYGLVQWTPRSKYWDWAVANNLPPREGNSQLARLNYEVENNIQWIPRSDYSNMTFSQFRQNTGNWSVDYLTEVFTWGYERPNQQAGWESMSARKEFANKCFTLLDWDGTGGGGLKPTFPTTEGLPITSPYGWRTHPISGEPDFHNAIDISGGGINHPIYATQSGKVIVSQFNEGGYGWYMVIQHTGDSYFSLYAHMKEKSPVPIGMQVVKGQIIGTMGTTGSSTGIHLHFEIATTSGGFGSEAGTINPELYLQMGFDDKGGSKHSMLIHFYLSGVFNDWNYYIQ